MAALTLELLTSDATKLMQKGIDELYAGLGAQLLACNLPTGAAGIMSYLSAVRDASDEKRIREALPSTPALSEWARGLGIIYEELVRQGARFMLEHRDDLQRALRHEMSLHLPAGSRTAIQALILVAEQALKTPPGFEPIAVTVAALLQKIGLEDFLSQKGNSETPPEIIDLQEVVSEPSVLWR